MHDVKLTLIGGPTVLIEIAGARFLTDPTFDAPGDYPDLPVRLEKLAGPAIQPDALPPVDAVLLSHDQHMDNLDRAGRAFLPKAGRVLTTPAGAARLGGGALGLAPFETVDLQAGGGRLFVTGTPARHGPAGIEPISGDVTGFLIGREAPGDAIYVTGDTVWYAGLSAVAERYRPKLVVAFAGSAEPRGPFHVTMDSNDVIELAAAFPAARIAAVHTEGWGHFRQGGGDLEASFRALRIAARLVGLVSGRAVAVPG